MQAIVEDPAEPDPIPGSVQGGLGHEKADLVRNALLEPWKRCHPMGGPLEQRQGPDPTGDRRRRLHGAGAVADHCDVLVLEGDIRSPSGGVERRASETLDARYVGQLWVVERTDR